MKIKTTTLDKIAALLFFALLTVATLCLGINNKGSHTLFLHKESAPTSPYELISFSAQQKDNNKYLNWSMTSSHDNFYFALERSVDGEHFLVVDLKRGASSPIQGQELRYSFIDREQVTGEKIYYRLRLLEIQATDMANKKAILSEEDMFQNNPMAAITLTNKQTTINNN
ncbi:MAG: hypothetical protein JWO09_3395 [Bacteroidetes bacterium]|nr:hypothetical protein [Bacteroidota bacterium]